VLAQKKKGKEWMFKGQRKKVRRPKDTKWDILESQRFHIRRKKVRPVTFRIKGGKDQ